MLIQNPDGTLILPEPLSNRQLLLSPLLLRVLALVAVMLLAHFG